jgi:hypothetical protein
VKHLQYTKGWHIVVIFRLGLKSKPKEQVVGGTMLEFDKLPNWAHVVPSVWKWLEQFNSNILLFLTIYLEFLC